MREGISYAHIIIWNNPEIIASVYNEHRPIDNPYVGRAFLNSPTFFEELIQLIKGMKR
jgi:hypothetical protein